MKGASSSELAAARILIVDDEIANVRLLERLLGRAGYGNLRSALDARTTLALRDELEPDLILQDLHLPDLASGIDLLTQITAGTPAGAYLPVLVITVDATSDALHQALAAGAKDFVKKPFDTREVLLRIQNLLETRFLHRMLQERNRAVTEAAAHAVSGTMADLVARRDVVVVAERIAASVRTLLQAKTARVYRSDPGTGDLVAIGTVGELDALGVAARMPEGAGVAGGAVRTGRPAVSLDLLNDPEIFYPEEILPRLRATSRRAALAVPLNVQGSIIGALVLVDDVGRTYSADDIAVAQAFADQAAIALELARVYEETEGARQAAEELARVAKSLTESLDTAAIGAQVVAAVTSLFQSQYCTLRLLQSDGTLRLIASGGPASHTLDMRRDLPGGAGLPGLVLGTGEAMWTHDALNDPRILDTPELRRGFARSEARAVLAVPLRVRGVMKGVLAIADRVGRRFSDRQVRLLQMLADQVAVALENARHYQAAQQAYEELSQTHAQLAQAQKMESIGRLAGGIAHDFNNLLTVITGRTALDLARLGSDEPARKGLALIEATAKRAAALTRQLLAFSRKQVLEPRILDLNVTLTGMEPILRRLIGEDMRVTIDPGPRLGRVKADPGQIEQVVLNLAVNARDAMPGGGDLAIKTANTVLSRAYARQHLDVAPGDYVMLAVSDTGVGMSPEVLSHIFEPFFTTKEPGKGTGLGLATVYGIVKQSGGHVTVESRVGHGTTFKVFLPRVEDAAVTDSAPEAGSAARGYETVLLAEDDPDVRSLALEILEAQGYTVLPAANGRDALDVAERHRRLIHILVTDVVMPEMNGADLARRLAGLRPGLRVLYMSGYTDDVIAREGVLEPGTALLEKPFAPSALIQKVREVLDAPATTP